MKFFEHADLINLNKIELIASVVAALTVIYSFIQKNPVVGVIILLIIFLGLVLFEKITNVKKITELKEEHEEEITELKEEHEEEITELKEEHEEEITELKEEHEEEITELKEEIENIEKTTFDINNPVTIQQKSIIILLEEGKSGDITPDRIIFDLDMVSKEGNLDEYWSTVSTSDDIHWSQMNPDMIGGNISNRIRRDIDNAARYLLKLNLDKRADKKVHKIKYKIDTNINTGKAFIDIREKTEIARVIIGFPEKWEIESDIKARISGDTKCVNKPKKCRSKQESGYLEGDPIPERWKNGYNSKNWLIWESSNVKKHDSYNISWKILDKC